MKRLTDPTALALRPSRLPWRSLAFHLRCLIRSGSRFEAETRLADALGDLALSDDDYHAVRVCFDALAEKGWPQ